MSIETKVTIFIAFMIAVGVWVSRDNKEGDED